VSSIIYDGVLVSTFWYLNGLKTYYPNVSVSSCSWGGVGCLGEVLDVSGKCGVVPASSPHWGSVEWFQFRHGLWKENGGLGLVLGEVSRSRFRDVML